MFPNLSIHYRKAERARSEPRLGRNKAIVAIARKMLIAVWHVLSEGCADRYADPEQVGSAMFRFAYKVGVKNLPEGVSTAQHMRDQLDKLGLGQELTEIANGTKQAKSRLIDDLTPPESGPPGQATAGG